MLSFKNLSLQRKQMLIIMLTSTVALLLACAAFIAYDVFAFRREMVESISSLAEVVGNNTTAALDFNDPAGAAQTLAALRGEPNIVLARVHTRAGQVFATYVREGAPPPPEIRDSLAARHEFTATHLHLLRAITQGGEKVGTIELVTDLSELKERLWRYAAIAGLVLAVSLLAAFGLSNRLQKLVSDPILHLAQVARSVALEKNYSLRATKRSTDELGQLVDGFNEMLGQIQQRDAALQSAHDELEARVVERTREVQQVNHALQAEVVEHIRAEEALHRSETKFHTLYDSNSDATMLLDEKGFSDCNPATLAMFGCATRKEFCAKHPADLSPPVQQDGTDSLTLANQHIATAMEKGRHHFEWLHKRADTGETFPADVLFTAMKLDDKPVLQAVVRDITERKKAETALTERTRLSALAGEVGMALTHSLSLPIMLQGCAAALVRQLDAAFARVWTLNEQTHVLELQASAGMYTHLDGPHGRVPVGKFKIGLIAQEQKPHLTNQVLGDPRVGDQEWAKREGMVAFAGYPLLVVDRVVGVMALFARHPLPDATLQAMSGIAGGIALGVQRMWTDAALRQSEARLRAITDSAQDAILMLDPEGRTSFWNPAAERILGYNSAEALGQNLHDLIAPARFHPAHHAAFPAFQQTGQGAAVGKTLELEARRKDGQEISVQLSLSAIQMNDGWHAVGLMRDVTERKRLQAELENTHKQLVDASRRGGMAEIATNVLHNVGNVLNSVNISTGLIVESVKKSRASSLARVVELLREHAHDLGSFMTTDSQGQQVPAYLAQLAEHLVADQAGIASELDSLQRNVEHIKQIVAMQQSYATFGGVKEMINVISLVEESLRINEGSLSRHGVAVIREFAKVPLMNVEKHKILQILVNLVRNAKYACDESKGADKRLTLRVTDGAGRVRISVIDNGVGIPPENLTRIFNHGFTTRKDGHGFGLHSGALAAREMGGSLTVQSNGPGQGAAFTLELPCLAQENPHE